MIITQILSMDGICHRCGCTYDEAMKKIHRKEPPFDTKPCPNVTQMYHFDDKGCCGVCVGPTIQSTELRDVVICPYCIGEYEYNVTKLCPCSFCGTCYSSVFYDGERSMSTVTQGNQCAGGMTLIIDKNPKNRIISMFAIVPDRWHNSITVCRDNLDEVRKLYVPGKSKLVTGFGYGSGYDMDEYEYSLEVLNEVMDISHLLPETLLCKRYHMIPDEAVQDELENVHSGSESEEEGEQDELTPKMKQIVTEEEIPSSKMGLNICDECVRSKLLPYMIRIEKMDYMPIYLTIAPQADIQRYIAEKDKTWVNEKMRDPEVRRRFYEEGYPYYWDKKITYKSMCSSFEDFDRRFVYNEMWDNWQLREKTPEDERSKKTEQRKKLLGLNKNSN